MSFDSRVILTESGTKDDGDINLFSVAMAFAAPSHDGISIDKYFQHMSRVSQDAGARYIELLNAGAKDDARTKLAALKHILGDREGYTGDIETYDDLQNADIIRVIERRKGLPIALCILYIHAGRLNGWSMDGLNFPGHFLARIEHGGERVIFDPFNACEIMEAPQLRDLIKRIRGNNAELSADYYRPCTNRDTLIRLQNNVKLRLIEAEEYAEALKSVEMMRLVDPQEYRLLLDGGVLYAKTGRNGEAVSLLDRYIALAPDARDRRDAEAIIRQIHEEMD